jgi:Cys-tRNA(Pro)/Cys-tRNA(Cys) deacylase
MDNKKTNAMRLLEQAGIAYEPLAYDLGDTPFSGEAVSRVTGIPAHLMVKTLTTRGTKKGVLIFVLPVDAELDLKKAAQAAGDKAVELVAVKDLPAITGYRRGEVSPIGMKKRYPITIDAGVEALEHMYVSAGKKGASVAVDPRALAAFLGATFTDIAVKR